MDLLSEIYERIAAFVDERTSLDDFRDWIAYASETADEEPLGDARSLSGRVWRHISEYGYGHLSDASLRAELVSIISPPAETWNRENAVAITTGAVSLSRNDAAAGERAGYQPGVLHLVVG